LFNNDNVYEYLKDDKTQYKNEVVLQWPYKDNIFKGSSRTRTLKNIILSDGKKIKLELLTSLEKKTVVKVEEKKNIIIANMAWKATGHYNSSKARKIIKKIYNCKSTSEAENKYNSDFSLLENAIDNLYKLKYENLFINPNLDFEEYRKFCSQKTIKKQKAYYFDKKKDAVIETIKNIDTDNLLIKGDNVQALIALQDRFEGKINCIYIDPPYNTGNDNFKYNDNWKHSEWLTFMRDRLKLAYKLLDEDGTMFIQISDKEFARLYLLMIELFGENNLKTISVKMAEPTGVKMTHVNNIGGIAKLKEHIILAKKNGIKNLTMDRIPKEKWDNEYMNLVKGITEDNYRELMRIIEDDYRTKEDCQKADKICSKFELVNVNSYLDKHGITNDEKREEWKFDNAWRIVRTVATTQSAKRESDKKREECNNQFFTITTSRNKMYIMRSDYDKSYSQPRIKLLFAESYLTLHPGDFWEDIKTTGLGNEGGVDLTNGKKPEKLLKRVIGMSTKKGDYVLDFFAGSGTTGAVAHKLERKWIMVEQLDYCDTLTKQRILNVLNGDQTGISEDSDVQWTKGGEFKYIELNENIEYSEEMFENDDNKKITEAKNIDLEATFNFYFGISTINKELIKIEDNYPILISYGKNALEENCLLILKDIDKEDFFAENKELITNRVNEWVNSYVKVDLSIISIAGKSFKIENASIPETEYEKIPPYFAKNILGQVNLP
jgi:adenine-specific DNA-methyltransferase